jgi:hypothetical protein
VVWGTCGPHSWFYFVLSCLHAHTILTHIPDRLFEPRAWAIVSVTNGSYTICPRKLLFLMFPLASTKPVLLWRRYERQIPFQIICFHWLRNESKCLFECMWHKTWAECRGSSADFARWPTQVLFSDGRPISVNTLCEYLSFHIWLFI